jgi:folate-binding protein YgfZ
VTDETSATAVTALILPAEDAQVIEVTGADRLAHLDATTTQALKDARPGTATAALVLDANGNPQAMFDVLVLPDRVLLVTPGPDVTEVVERIIAGRTFLADARFRVTDLTVVRAVVDPALVRRAWSGASVVPEPGTVRSTPTGDTSVAADADSVLTLVGPSPEVARLVGALRDAGAMDADTVHADTWRVDAGRAAWGVEVAPPHLPEELGLLPTHVHLAKGCYPGQEAVARMWMLGRPRRRLARVRIDGDAALLADVRAGWRTGEGRDAVEVTTLAPRGIDGGQDGGVLALAFVPGASAVGERLTGLGEEGGTAIEVLEILGDDPVPPGHDPAMRRRRDRTAPQGAG